MVDVQFVRVGRTFGCSWLALAFDVDFEDDGIAVCGLGVGHVAGLDEGGIDVEGDEANAVCEDFVDDN